MLRKYLSTAAVSRRCSFLITLYTLHYIISTLALQLEKWVATNVNYLAQAVKVRPCDAGRGRAMTSFRGVMQDWNF